MEDQLTLRTLRLLTDYLEHCARRPSCAPRPPSSLEAAVMRSLSSRIQEHYQLSWTRFRRSPGNRVEMVATAMQNVFRHPRGPSWGRVVALVAFAGFLLERPPASHTWALKEWNARVDRDCQSLVTLLCACLTGQHRTWLEAQGGWDGFCHFFRVTRSRWRKVMVPFLLSCLTLTIITYLCKN
ncbi:bcl-2-like protein 10 [Eptesicus fuscus]|uniref:bcl-2-like protein 10 n=1 Tax=Eptesicus fuscus TaxID=29078 RepID=UPI00046B809E|nr:bcl-2-like protein 10 [Eptesicus fuscus]